MYFIRTRVWQKLLFAIDLFKRRYVFFSTLFWWTYELALATDIVKEKCLGFSNLFLCQKEKFALVVAGLCITNRYRARCPRINGRNADNEKNAMSYHSYARTPHNTRIMTKRKYVQPWKMGKGLV